MPDNNEAILRAILGLVARRTFPVEQLAAIVLKGGGEKQLRAFNMADGTLAQSEIAKKLKIDPASISRTVARWISAGVVFRLGEGRDAKLLHIYPLPRDAVKASRRK